ncbi:TRAP transporter substrate-binding protein [Fodinicurvata sp. EGI_FJ10296]|uniref:TRAP transporter substrate-binding protein n=1 Tax=Fodinicurvata sp. EGI_FJ10296 TaxID=3231908 RepID=UPI003456440A
MTTVFKLKNRTAMAAVMAAAAVAAGTGAASAQTTWDMAVVWPEGNFHTQNHNTFAEAVEEATDGEVQIQVHSGGALGLGGPEMLAAVRDRIVPIGDILLNQQVGEEPIFGMESLPYLAPSFDDLAVLQGIARDHYDEVAERNNQKILYMVPWPGQAVYTTEPVETIEDLEGVQIRVVDSMGSRFFEALGASPVQLPWGEVVPGLATGTINGVTTSSSSGVDGNFWEFLDYMNRFNWQGSAIMVNVNLDAWNALSEEHREAIEAIAEDLEPQFWENARAEDEEKIAILEENGIEVTEPTPELRESLLEVSRPMWEEFMEDVPESREIIEAYLEEVGR